MLQHKFCRWSIHSWWLLVTLILYNQVYNSWLKRNKVLLWPFRFVQIIYKLNVWTSSAAVSIYENIDAVVIEIALVFYYWPVGLEVMEEEFKCHHFHIRLFEKMIDRKIVGFLFCMCQLYYFSFEFHGNLVINHSWNNFLHINKMQIHIYILLCCFLFWRI